MAKQSLSEGFKIKSPKQIAWDFRLTIKQHKQTKLICLALFS
jgi:hypothetical protein